MAAVKIVLGSDGVNSVTMDYEYMLLELAPRLAGKDGEIPVLTDNDFKKLESRLAVLDGEISVPMDIDYEKLELAFLLAGFDTEISVPMDYDKAAAAFAGKCVLTSSLFFEESERALFFSKG